MAIPASKRRKLAHTSSSDEDDDASLASFTESDEAESEDELHRQEDESGIEDEGGPDEGSEDVHEDEDEDEDVFEDLEDEESNGSVDDGQVVTEKDNRSSGKSERATQRRSDNTTQNLAAANAYTAGTFKSNVFKLQVDELLEQIRPRRGKREEAAENALHALKRTIEQTPAKGSMAVEDAERQLLKPNKVATPFPSPRPPKDAKYKLEFARPASINVVGSYALKVASRSNGHLEVDLMVQMPSSLFQEKDYLNHRYFYKRAYYLACMSASIKAAHSTTYHLTYEDLHGDQLKPILVVRPTQNVDEIDDAKAVLKWRINIIPCVAIDAFPKDKLSPERNCVRPPPGHAESQPTPFYNSSVRADMLVPSYLKLLHTSANSCSAFKDACLLGNTWLSQRGFSASITQGGFGSFEWAALMALLLQGGGPGGKPILSGGYSSYQLFKATLQVLATYDLKRKVLVIGPGDVKPLGNNSPMVWDAAKDHNLLYKVAPWSYSDLRQQARTTITMLGDQLFDGFEASFILRADNPLLRYDYLVEIPAAEASSEENEVVQTPATSYKKLYGTLKQGLDNRVSLITILAPPTQSWHLGSARPTISAKARVRVGLVANADNAKRTVDHGPSAENKAETAAFRKFWGEKAELRRFRDGSILESLIWSPIEDGQSVLEQIVRFLIRRHLSESAEEGVIFIGHSFQKLLGQGSGVAPFQPLIDAYKQLESDIRGLEEMPLSVRQIMPADPQLRYASIQLPFAARGSQGPVPANVTIQFEGSTRWPDNLVAIQRTKIAFLLDISKRLDEAIGTVTTRVSLENQEHDILNQAYLDIIYDSGATFRMRVHHDREQTLLERQLKDKSLAPSAKEAAAVGLAAYKRDFLKNPAHTQAIARLCSRYPLLSGSIRLAKKWFASHLLTNHFSDEVIELIVARTFVQPWPWQVPSSVQTGFLRTLHWLSRWDWRTEPLVVDLSGSGELKQLELQAIQTRFEAWRKLDPGLNRIVLFAASNADSDGTTWTDGHPAKVIAGRMTALAKAAWAEVAKRQLELEPLSLFASPLSDYDFLLYLNEDVTGGNKRKGGARGVTFKNLELAVSRDESMVGFKPAMSFLDELQNLYGSAIVFFSGGCENTIIAGLWSPQTARRNWKVNLAYSTVPVRSSNTGEVQAEINKEAILAEIARLGGDMVERIELNR